MKKEKMIPVNDHLGEMLNWAVRYALGRRTYAVMDTCNYIKPLIKDLSNRTLYCMSRDIKDQKKDGYGDQCDIDNWLELLDLIDKELTRRTDSIVDASDH